MMLHLGAVLSHAQWPAVTCMNMYVNQLVTTPLVVEGGFLEVPQKPGLGIEFDERALKYRVNSPDKPPLDAIYALVRSNGQKIWYPAEYGPNGYWTESWAGNLPPFEHGVRLEQRFNDGSADYKDMAARLKNEAVWE